MPDERNQGLTPVEQHDKERERREHDEREAKRRHDEQERHRAGAATPQPHDDPYRAEPHQDQHRLPKTSTQTRPKAEAREGEAAEAPSSAVDAQAQGHVEHAERQAAIAEANAKAAVERAEKMNEVVNPPDPPPEGEAAKGRNETDFDRHQRERSQVVAHSGQRNVPMEMDEDARLLAHKQMVFDHLNNAEPDMTGGTGLNPDGTPQLDPQTALPKGHVPEGHSEKRP